MPEKVIIDSITFSRNEAYKEKNGILVLVSGTSVDRNSLISFSNSLEQSKDFTFVDVPVSSLTKDKNLPFSINIFIENYQNIEDGFTKLLIKCKLLEETK